MPKLPENFRPEVEFRELDIVIAPDEGADGIGHMVQWYVDHVTDEEVRLFRGDPVVYVTFPVSSIYNWNVGDFEFYNLLGFEKGQFVSVQRSGKDRLQPGWEIRNFLLDHGKVVAVVAGSDDKSPIVKKVPLDKLRRDNPEVDESLDELTQTREGCKTALNQVLTDIGGHRIDENIHTERKDELFSTAYYLYFQIMKNLTKRLKKDLRQDGDVLVPLPRNVADKIPTDEVELEFVYDLASDLIYRNGVLGELFPEQGDMRVDHMAFMMKKKDCFVSIGLTERIADRKINLDLPIPETAIVSQKSTPEQVYQYGNVYAYTTVGGRKENQDGFYYDPESGKHGRMAIADGMGGEAHGEEASHIALKTVALNPGHSYDIDMLASTASEAMRKNPVMGPYSRGGTTLTFARPLSVTPGVCAKYEISHIGDSIPIVFYPASRSILYQGTPQNMLGFNMNGMDPNEISRLAHLESSNVRGPLTQEACVEIYRMTGPGSSSLFSDISPNTDSNTESHTETMDLPNGAIVFMATDGVLEVVSIYELSQLFFDEPFEKACNMLKAKVDKRKRTLKQGRSIEIQVAPETFLTVNKAHDNATFAAQEVAF